MTAPTEQCVRDLRLDRRALRAERARVGWWRRLVRARLDLAVAQVARPQTLGEDVAFQLPLDVGVDVPRPAELAAVLTSTPAAETARSAAVFRSSMVVPGAIEEEASRRRLARRTGRNSRARKIALPAIFPGSPR